MTHLKWYLDLLPINHPDAAGGKYVCDLSLYVRAVKTETQADIAYTTTFHNNVPEDLMDHLPVEIFTSLERAFAQYVVSNVTKVGLTEATLQLEEEIHKANRKLELWVK